MRERAGLRASSDLIGLVLRSALDARPAARPAAWPASPLVEVGVTAAQFAGLGAAQGSLTPCCSAVTPASSPLVSDDANALRGSGHAGSAGCRQQRLDTTLADDRRQSSPSGFAGGHPRA